MKLKGKGSRGRKTYIFVCYLKQFVVTKALDLYPVLAFFLLIKGEKTGR